MRGPFAKSGHRSCTRRAVQTGLLLVGVWAWIVSPWADATLVDERIALDGESQVELTFSRPGLNGQSSMRLENRIVDLIAKATPGSAVHVSMYTFRSKAVAEALVEAARRGAKVKVLVDGASLRSNNPALHLLRAGCGKQCLKVCRSGCHGSNINHNKFFLFSELTDAGMVVAQSSANLTPAQHRHYNDLIVVKNDPSLYQAFREYFDDLSRRVQAPRYYRVRRGDAPISVHFFPRLLRRDPVVRILDKVACEPDSRIRVAHSRFDAHRIGVARQLRRLTDSGCDVHVILRTEPELNSPAPAVMDELDGLVTLLPYKRAGADQAHNAIHTKLILIKAPFAKSKEERHIVLTGSHNLSFTSLRLNDDTLLRVEDEAVFSAYEAFWDSILSPDGGI